MMHKNGSSSCNSYKPETYKLTNEDTISATTMKYEQQQKRSEENPPWYYYQCARELLGEY